MDTRCGDLRTPSGGLSRPPRLVALGGGTGLPTLLQGLAHGLRTAPAVTDGPWDLTDCLSAVVAITDDGGSSGRLRRHLGVLPPGDVRNCLAALAAQPTPLSRVLQYRFSHRGELKGHAVGNLMLAALTQMTGDFSSAVDQLGTMIGVVGRVLPCSDDNVNLVAELDDGEIVSGETAIVRRGKRIRRVWLERPARPLPDVIRVLINADTIVVGPGSLYTSLIPTLLVGGVAPTIRGARAARIYVANLMTQRGETDGFTLEDHLRVLAAHAGPDLFDYIVVNSARLSPSTLREQQARGGAPVLTPAHVRHLAGHAMVIRAELAAALPTGEVRHAPDRLAAVIFRITAHHQRREALRLARPTADGTLPVVRPADWSPRA